MKSKLYYGNNPLQFAPCEAVLTQREESIKLHPAILAIRNRRKRMRWVKQHHRLGVRFFVRPVWEIYPANRELSELKSVDNHEND